MASLYDRDAPLTAFAATLPAVVATPAARVPGHGDLLLAVAAALPALVALLTTGVSERDVVFTGSTDALTANLAPWPRLCPTLMPLDPPLL